MTDIDERLRSLREVNRDGPPAAELRNRATRRRTRRRFGALAVGVIGVIGLGTMWTVHDDDAANLVTAGTTEDGASPESQRTIGTLQGVTVSVSPSTELRDGNIVEVSIEGIAQAPGASILMCAGDVTESDAVAACDITSVHQSGIAPGLPVPALEGTQSVSLPRVIQIARPSGDPNQAVDYDCATEPAGCVLAVGPYELPARAVVVPLSFRDGELPEPAAALNHDKNLADGQEVTLIARDLGPNRAFTIHVCQASPSERCDEIGEWSSATSDETGALETAVAVHAALYGWQGRVDCTSEACAVVVTGDAGRRLVEVPVTFAANVVAPLPELRLDPPGPYTDGQEVTVHGSGFRAGVDLSGHLGQCPAQLDTAVAERCGYPSQLSGPILVGADGTFMATLALAQSLPLTGSCIGEPGCVLAWVIPHGPIGARVPLNFAP
jgi:hypothetical protein